MEVDAEVIMVENRGGGGGEGAEGRGGEEEDKEWNEEEEVEDDTLLVAHLQVGHGDTIHAFIFVGLDLLEEVIQGQHHNPHVICSAKHSVCFTST